MTENKAGFVQELGELLAKYSREDIEGMNYDKDSDGFEGVTIRYDNDEERTINVTCDSCLAIMIDVYEALR
jgi:hypothetical protein